MSGGQMEGAVAFCFISGWIIGAIGMMVHLGLFSLGKTTMFGPWWWVGLVGLLLMNVGGLLDAMVGES